MSPEPSPPETAPAPVHPVADRAPAVPDTLAIMPVRKMVLFPGLVVTLTVDEPGARQLLEESLPRESIIGIFTQRPEAAAPPDFGGLNRVGVAANVLKLNRADDGALRATLSVLARIGIRRGVATTPFLRAEIEVLRPAGPAEDDRSWRAVVQELREHALQYAKATPNLPAPTVGLVRTLEDPGQLADLVAASLPLTSAQKQDLLELLDVPRRVRAVLVLVSDQLEVARLREKIDRDVAAHFTTAQRRTYLREQLRTIQRELGEDGADQLAAELRTRIEAAGLPEAARLLAERELRRLGRLPPTATNPPSSSPTSNSSRNCPGMR